MICTRMRDTVPSTPILSSSRGLFAKIDRIIDDLFKTAYQLQIVWREAESTCRVVPVAGAPREKIGFAVLRCGIDRLAAPPSQPQFSSLIGPSLQFAFSHI